MRTEGLTPRTANIVPVRGVVPSARRRSLQLRSDAFVAAYNLPFRGLSPQPVRSERKPLWARGYEQNHGCQRDRCAVPRRNLMETVARVCGIERRAGFRPGLVVSAPSRQG